MQMVFMAIALVVSVVAAGTDVATRKIPNALTYGTAIAALLGRLVLEGWRSAVLGVAGGLVGGAVLFAFYMVRAMGAGDVKLMTAVGCFAGPQRAVEILLATAIAGGVLALAYAVLRGRLRTTLRNLVGVIRFHAAHGPREHPTVNLDNEQALRMPYGIAIAAGVLYSFSAALLVR
jgi:prepilin peptidase CpaA